MVEVPAGFRLATKEELKARGLEVRNGTVVDPMDYELGALINTERVFHREVAISDVLVDEATGEISMPPLFE